MKRVKKRLFWRIYLYGLLFLLVTIATVTFAIVLLQPESRFHGRPGQYYSLLASELSRYLQQPDELQEAITRYSESLQQSFAVYDQHGHLLAKAGSIPPLPLEKSQIDKIGKWHPVHTENGWVYTAPIGGEPDDRAPYLVVSGGKGGGKRFLFVLFAVLLAAAGLSWPLTKRLSSPLEQLTQTANSLAAGDLTARSTIRRKDEIGELARAFDNMANQLETRIRNEKELFANISHEIRTPLARLRVAVELCEDSPGNLEQIMSRLQGMGQDLSELEQLIDNVLISSRLELTGEGAQFRKQIVHAPAFFKEVSDRFQRYFPERELDLQINHPLPDLLLDPSLMHRVFANLLENAAKYSLTDPIKMEASSSRDQVYFIVSDQGEGVPEEDLDRLFDPFFRSDRSRNRRTGGSGLGLTLCKRIVAAHGGDITAMLNTPAGMKFLITLPNQQTSQET